MFKTASLTLNANLSSRLVLADTTNLPAQPLPVSSAPPILRTASNVSTPHRVTLSAANLALQVTLWERPASPVLQDAPPVKVGCITVSEYTTVSHVFQDLILKDGSLIPASVLIDSITIKVHHPNV